MKVDIRHEEVKKGLVFKKAYQQVTVQVQFTDEEKKIIKDNGGWNFSIISLNDGYKLVDKDGRAPHVVLVTHLLDGPSKYCLLAKGEAKTYEALVVERLRELKVWLTNNGAIENKATSFDL